MYTATLAGEEMACLARHCRWLGLGYLRPLPAPIFRAFLVAKLARREPTLAGKVAAMPGGELGALRDELRERQEAAHSLVFG
jgi:hypothetical protein